MLKTNLRFSLFEMDRIIVSLLDNITNVKFVQNVKTLFNSYNEASYVNDEEKVSRVYLVKELTNVILEQNIQAKSILLNTISFNGRYADKETEILNNIWDQSISEKETLILDKKISQLLKYATIEQTTDALIQNVNDIKSENYDDLEAKISAVETEINKIDKDLKEYRETIEESNNTVALDSPEFLTRLSKVIEHEKNPSSTIRCGIKLFNDILGGGFKAGRVYCAMAPMKNWKSGFLLTTGLGAKKYNDIKAKDPTKKPIVLYITLENSIDETIVRTLAYCEGNSYRMEDHSPTENFNILKAHGLFDPSNDLGLGIELMYKPNKSITVKDIQIIMEEYEKKGKEVVFLIVDYLKRLRPSVITKDLRIDLGGIADELHVLAIEKDIPILTAMQLNRSAISEIDNAITFEQKVAAFGRIGASNVGESIDIPQNVDLAFTMLKNIDIKYNEEGEVDYVDKFMQFKVIASRYNTGGDYDEFIHRFKEGNDMCLEEDADSAFSKSITSKSILIKDKVNSGTEIKTKGVRHV